MLLMENYVINDYAEIVVKMYYNYYFLPSILQQYTITYDAKFWRDMYLNHSINL